MVCGTNSHQLTGLVAASNKLAWEMASVLCNAPKGTIKSAFMQWEEEVSTTWEAEEPAFLVVGSKKWQDPRPWCSEEGLSLVTKMLQQSPNNRITLTGALHDPYLQEGLCRRP